MIVYHDKLDKLFDARIPSYESIKTIEFGGVSSTDDENN
jgi:hypothetical protein